MTRPHALAGDLTAADLGRRVIVHEPHASGTVTRHGAVTPIRLVNVRHYLERFNPRRDEVHEVRRVWVLVERVGHHPLLHRRRNIPLDVDSRVEFVVVESDLCPCGCDRARLS